MAEAVIDVWSDLPAWQGLIERHRALFTPLVDGTAVAFLPRTAADAIGGEMLVWVRDAAGMRVEKRRFTGFADCAAHLLFVAETGTLERLHGRIADNPWGAMKLSVRDGSLLLYVLEPKTQLLDDGLEDFLDVLGLAFLGACR
jgi:hypothetical protein